MPARNAPMIAASPIWAAMAASPRQMSTAGSSGDSEKRGACRSAGRDCRSLVPPTATEPTNARALGGCARRPRDGQQREDVVDDRGAEDRPARSPLERAELDEHGRRDAHARRHERRSEEERGRGALAAGEAKRDPARERDRGAEHADRESRLADLAQVRQPRLEADPEETDDDAELREDLERLVGLHA